MRANPARLALLLSLLIAISPARAELVDNGNFTTDTTSGLDWLDLSESAGVAWSEAEEQHPGWRRATTAEIEALFPQLFPAFDLSLKKAETERGEYPEFLDELDNFRTLFGITYQEEKPRKPGMRPENMSFGFYMAKTEELTILGVRETPGNRRIPDYHLILGLKHFPVQPYDPDMGIAYIGTFLVRPAENVKAD